MNEAMGIPLDDIAHIIQVALAPVFLLAGISSLLNVITARLGRIADQTDEVAQLIRAGLGTTELRVRHARLRRRLRALDVARAAGALAGVGTCGATFALFVGALQNTAAATALFVMFGGSILLTMAAMVALFVETLLSSHRGNVPQVDA